MNSRMQINTEPLVSIVILSWNRKDDLKLSLEKIKELTYANKEVIVVDNASKDGSIEMIEGYFPTVKLIKLPRNTGIEGFNVGYINAKGKYILVLDDDSYTTADVLNKLVEKIESNEKIAVVGAQIIDPKDGKIYTKGPDDFETEYTSFWGGGALLRTKAIIECGMYDYRLFVYTNEYELCVRLMNAGYSIRYDKSTTIYHSFSPVSRFSKVKWWWGRNEIWFNLRYIPLYYLPLTLPRSFMWMLMLSRHSYKEMGYQMLGMLNGFFSFPYKERKPVKKEVLDLLIRHHWTFVPPLKFIYLYFKQKRHLR